MDITLKIEELGAIYDRFDHAAAGFKTGQLCRAGCSFCCTDAGNIDITTLEGLVIREHILTMPKPQRTRIQKELARNRRMKERRNTVKCPFLNKKDHCAIYDIRPFSCRQLYSLEPCDGRGPTIHKAIAELAKETVKELQRLDDTGYSGHISFILHLLEQPQFRRLYLSGGFDPTRIMDYGKTHGMVINRIVAGRTIDETRPRGTLHLDKSATVQG